MKFPSLNFGKKDPAAPKPAPEKKPVPTPKPAPVKAAPVPKAAAAKSSPPNAVIGLTLVVIAFIGLVAIMYLMMQTIMKKDANIKKLDELVLQLKQEKDISQAEIDNLKAQGDSIKLDKLVETAKAFYDDKEKSRREGLVWINRKNKTYIVTLGAIHGLKAGSTLSVYEGGNKVGKLQVDTPYDVISFCSPVKAFPDSANKNYYQVIIE